MLVKAATPKMNRSVITKVIKRCAFELLTSNMSYKLDHVKCRNNFLLMLYNDAASLPDFRTKWYHNEMVSFETQ